jgi:TonB family protein
MLQHCILKPYDGSGEHERAKGSTVLVSQLEIPSAGLQGIDGGLQGAYSRTEADSLQSSVVVPLSFGPRINSDARRYSLALVAAAAFHLAVLVAIWPAHTENLGETGAALESIAVTLVDSVQMVSAPDATSPKEPQAEAEAAPQAVAEPEQPVPPKDPVTMAMAPDPEPEPDAVPAREREPDPKPKHVERAPQPARAAPTVLPSVSTAEANAGVERAYAKRLAELLDSRKPGSLQTRGLRGTVTVRFVVLETGKADGITVLKSSGNGTLDGLVVATIEHLQLPPPPPEMSQRQRTFNAPFAFR